VLNNSGPKSGQYNMSIHSQAVGPPLSTFEMAEVGLTFKKIAERMVYKMRENARGTLRRARALEGQFVDPNDSVLGALSRYPKDGLSTSFRALTLQAFVRAWVNPTTMVNIGGESYELIEANWPLIWGLAIGEYERTLKSTRSKFERYARGDSSALTDQEKLGLDVFANKGKCINCHDGPTFSKATAAHIRKNSPQEFIERMNMSTGVAIYDNGFYNIGVRPTNEDPGVGASDGAVPLSRTRQSQQFCGDNTTADGPDIPGFCFEPVVNEPGVTGEAFISESERVAVNGAFKTPTLLNVALTAPYFHNGGMLTLEQVVEFYDRGGDFADRNKADLDPDITTLGLTIDEEKALVAFLKTLTDPRVARDAAPFDHPSLCIPVYHGDPATRGKGIQDANGDWLADVVKECIPATGRGGMRGSSIAKPSTPNFPAYAPPTP
jgi:cytochrome c peroxidase